MLAVPTTWLRRRAPVCDSLSSSTARLFSAMTSRFFFFQAEDGIRDLIVTGVQTCALQIYPAGALDQPFTAIVSWGDGTADTAVVSGSANPFTYTFTGNHTYAQNGTFDVTVSITDRSEERRVGKEGRSRWSPYH